MTRKPPRLGCRGRPKHAISRAASTARRWYAGRGRRSLTMASCCPPQAPPTAAMVLKHATYLASTRVFHSSCSLLAHRLCTGATPRWLQVHASLQNTWMVPAAGAALGALCLQLVRAQHQNAVETRHGVSQATATQRPGCRVGSSPCAPCPLAAGRPRLATRDRTQLEHQDLASADTPVAERCVGGAV